MANGTEEKYIVAALTAGLPDKYEDCLLAKESDVIITTHSKVFGPDSKEACEKWMSENCGKPTETKYIVASLSASLPKYEDCIVVRDGDSFPAIYTKVFGPKSEDECRKWRDENCGKETKPIQPVGDQPGGAGGGQGDDGAPPSRNAEGEEQKDKRWFWVSVGQNVLLGVVVLILLYIFSKGLEPIFLGGADVTSDERARNLITYLVCFGTIFIAVLAALTAMFIREPDRFTRAKDILGVLVGILGTIVGFYFGQTADKPNNDARGTGASQVTIGDPTFEPDPLRANQNANFSFNISGGSAPYSYRISIPEANANIQDNTETGEVRKTFPVNTAVNVNAANYSIEVTDAANKTANRKNTNKIVIQQ